MPESAWSGGRNHYLAVWGEYEPCAGYTYKRELFASETSHPAWGQWLCRDIVVTAELRIDDNRRGFTCTVGLGGAEYRVAARGRCSSIRDAKRQADKALSKSDVVRAALVDFYRRRYAVTKADGSPFATLFCSDYFMLPSGEWVVRHGEWVTEVRRFACGTSSSSSRVTAETAEWS